MKKALYTITFMILMIGLLTGCASSTPAPATPAPTAVPTEVPSAAPTEAPTTPAAAPVVVTDSLGRTVEFEQVPLRIVLIGKALPMIINTLYLFPEAPERIVAIEQRSQNTMDFLGTAFPKTSGVTLLEMDAGPEQVAPLNPDLVIMKSNLQEKLGSPIELLGIKVVYLDLETPEQFSKDLRTIGQVFDNPDRAEQLVSLYETATQKVTDATASLTEANKPAVLLLQYSDKGGEVAFSVPPATYLQTLLVEMAGGTPVWKETITDGGWTVVTLEQIAAWNPVIIFIVDYKGNAVSIVENLKADANWAALEAIKNGSIHAFPMDYLSWDQPDPRWGLGLTWMATRIHPELFASIDMSAEIKSFYVEYYGLDEKLVEEKILPMFKGDL